MGRKNFETVFIGNGDDYFDSFDYRDCGAGAEDGRDGRCDGRGFRFGRPYARQGRCAGKDDGRHRGGLCADMSLARWLYEYVLRGEGACDGESLLFLCDISGVRAECDMGAVAMGCGLLAVGFSRCRFATIVL